MEPEIRNQCLKLIQKLMKHSIAEIFISPVDPILDNVPDYPIIIKKPSDLSTVKRKLVTKQYDSIESFEKDVDQIWENAYLYNNPSSLPGIMARRLSHIFHRELSKIETRPYDTWVSDYLKIQSDFTELFKDQPGLLKTFNLTPDLETLVPERRVGRSVLTQDDTKFFSEAFKLIENPSYISKVIQTIREYEQNIDFNEEEVKINLSALSSRTIRHLKTCGSEMKEPSRAVSQLITSEPL